MQTKVKEVRKDIEEDINLTKKESQICNKNKFRINDKIRQNDMVNTKS